MGYLSPPPSPQAVIVYKDVGGLVSDYEAQTEAYRRENREVRLHECRSACTLALSLPNVCVYPDAQVKFHQAYNETTRETDYGVSEKLFDSYPAAVRARLGTLTRQYRVLTGAELIELGVRNCLRDDRTLVAGRRPAKPTVVAAASQPQAAPDPGGLQDFARTLRVAVAQALSRPEGAPIPPIVVEDRTAAPEKIVSPREAQIVATLVAPLPPRRPQFGAVAISTPRLDASTLIPGAHPILDATRFAPQPSRIAAADDQL